MQTLCLYFVKTTKNLCYILWQPVIGAGQGSGMYYARTLTPVREG